MSAKIAQRYENNTTVWTTAHLTTKSDNEPCSSLPTTNRGGMRGLPVTTNHSVIFLMANQESSCEKIWDLNFSNSISFERSYMVSMNLSTGAEDWLKAYGPGRIQNWVYTDATLAILGDEIIFCGSPQGGQFYLNSSTINLGSLGFVSFNATTGNYVSHSSVYSNSYTGSCNSVVQYDSKLYYTLSYLSKSGSSPYQYSVLSATLLSLDSSNNLDHIYTLSGAIGSGVLMYFDPDTKSLIYENPKNLNIGSGVFPGGDGFGVFVLGDDHDQDNIGDGVDNDDDGDGISDLLDQCPRGRINWTPDNNNDPDSDGCHSSEDEDRDNDGIADALDSCDSVPNSFVSSNITDYDSDGCRDSTEDFDDDGDLIPDVDDNCRTSSDLDDVYTNDRDADGCGDSTEDSDDDNDGIDDTVDQCVSIPNSWVSSSETDHDGDGCRDTGEDNNDDNDYLVDSVDSCPTGKLDWVGNSTNDMDGDGCFDPTEDSDDDNDGVPDLSDACPTSPGDSSFGSLIGCPDSDNDGFGDNIDRCKDVFGLSFIDVYGCVDSDGDGYSDDGDAFPSDPNAFLDSDSDGVRDEDDVFPFLSGQWQDADGDGYGDNNRGPNPDYCPDVSGNSTLDVFGCLDVDGDGYSELFDKFPTDPTQWQDSDDDGITDSEDIFPFDPSQTTDADGDGFGDNPRGTGADKFPEDATQWSDIDGDGYGDNMEGTTPDAFIADPTQWSDVDGDGYGDNPTGRLADAFPNDPTQWEDLDGDGFGDNLSGNNPDPYLFDFDNDGYNDSIDPLPKLASPGDLDNDGVLDENDAFPEDYREWADADGDGEGDNADTDDDNDGWTDTDEVRQGTDPFSSSSQPIDGFEVIIPGTQVSLGAWDLIGIFGGVPVFIWIAIGFATRNGRTARYEEMLRGAQSVEDLERISGMWEYSLMMRMLGPHQGIRLERLRADLEYEFLGHRRTSTLVDEYDQTDHVEKSLPGLEQAVAHEPMETQQPPQSVATTISVPTADTAAQRSDENGYEWFTMDDGTNFYRTVGSTDEWVKFEN
ncbi:MAG: hypothetical protein O3B67_00080 [archaeon]|nr:hypothetical protein [archaeon]